MKLKEELKKQMKENSGYLIFLDVSLYKKVINLMIKSFKDKTIDKIISPEMKGVFYGPTIAYKMNLPFVPILKKGRVPKIFVVRKSFKDYTKKKKTLDLGKETIKKGDKVLIVDDVFESGESGRAIIKMIEKLGGKVVGISIVYNKLNKKDEEFFERYNLHYLVKL
ncbi:hypothetical protein KAT80_01205 [Candidatus Pacearchaeota archaeon]|nr:hypothetical protein [Candidatus Pacearchaeota archaeon]